MPRLTEIEARVLPTPKLECLKENQDKSFGFTPKEGTWEMKDKRMIVGGNMEFWSYVNFSQNRNAASRFRTELIATCKEKGMTVLDPLHVKLNGDPRDIEKTLTDTVLTSDAAIRRKGHEDKHLQLLIIILPDDHGQYGKIKRVCETKLGIVSQCCQPTKVVHFGHSIKFRVNVALKINAKVGGKNVVWEKNKCKYDDTIKTIIFGADVTHPQPGDDSSPSIAAVVASTDWPQPTNYRAAVKSQAPRREIIEDLGSMVREHLTAFKNANGCDPQRMLFYRDGVSEGQFNQVLEQEVKAIRKVCNENMKLTFVVVQKRHHTRLFPKKEENDNESKKNIPPGTVVDTEICHPWQFDFYLCSHHGTKGTSRPTHYHVLCDDNKFTSNQLQTLTNDLCYTYARCTRSVSVVPSAYYAHLAAFRARYYIEDDKEASSSGEVPQLPEIKDDVKKVMFYC